MHNNSSSRSICNSNNHNSIPLSNQLTTLNQCSNNKNIKDFPRSSSNNNQSALNLDALLTIMHILFKNNLDNFSKPP